MSISEKPHERELKDAAIQNELKLMAESMVVENWMLWGEINDEFQYGINREDFVKLLRNLGVSRINKSEQTQLYRKSERVVGSKKFGSKLTKWKARGHLFGPDLVCQRCNDADFASHQAAPSTCVRGADRETRTNRYGQFTPDMVAQMLQMRLDGGRTTNAIGEQFGCS